MEHYHSECVMHMKDRITRMLLPVLGHADTKHVVPAPCMTLLQRPGGQMQSLNASGGHATRWDAAAHRTSRRPSSLSTVLEKCTHQTQCCGVASRRAADGLPRQAGSSAAAQQLKFSRKQQSARQGESQQSQDLSRTFVWGRGSPKCSLNWSMDAMR